MATHEEHLAALQDNRDEIDALYRPILPRPVASKSRKTRAKPKKSPALPAPAAKGDTYDPSAIGITDKERAAAKRGLPLARMILEMSAAHREPRQSLVEPVYEPEDAYSTVISDTPKPDLSIIYEQARQLAADLDVDVVVQPGEGGTYDLIPQIPERHKS